MGWTYKPAKFYKNGKVDRKAELDAEFTWSNESGSGEILKSTMVGTTYYAAFKRTRTNGESEVYAIVTLTHIDRNSWCNFGYKDMSEDMGPCEHGCPENILSLLSPTDNEYALQWRAACREERKRKSEKSSLSLLPVGTVIEIQRLGKKERLRKMPPSHQFKTPFWMFEDKYAYLPKNHIPNNYVVVN